MKKILAIMLIAVIAVAGAFADGAPAYTVPGDTTVHLNYVVEGLYHPAYKLYYGNTESAASIIVKTNDGTDVGILAGETNTFTLYDFTKVNSPKDNAFTLAVSVQNKWTGSENGSTDSAAASSISINSFELAATQVTNAVSYALTSSPDANGVVVTYVKNQTTDRSADANKKALATFKVVWTPAPAAIAANYTADLTVAVKTK